LCFFLVIPVGNDDREAQGYHMKPSAGLFSRLPVNLTPTPKPWINPLPMTHYIRVLAICNFFVGKRLTLIHY
jgi:hypothetical protein